VEAYNTLSDPDLRATYDGCGLKPEVSTSACAAKKTDTDKGQLAKDVFARMLQTHEEEWNRLLEGVDASVVEALDEELDQLVTAENDPGEDADDAKGNNSDYAAPGIKRRKDGTWWVQIAWRNFKACADRIKCMERAVNLHTALVDTRNAAMARYKNKLVMLKTTLKCGGMSGADEDLIPVLTPGELQALLQEEPYIPIRFSSDLTAKPRVQTPWTPSFERAMEFRMFLRQVKAHDGSLEALKSQMSEVAKEDRTDRKGLTLRAASLLKRVAEVRREERRTLQNPHHESSTPLALKAVANTEEILKSLKASEDRISALEDSSEAERAAHRRFLEELEQRYQSQMEALLESHQKQTDELLEEKQELLGEKQRQIEEHYQEKVQQLQEQLDEERRERVISDQVAHRLDIMMRPRPLLFARPRIRGIDTRRDENDTTSRWLNEAVRSSKRALEREALERDRKKPPASALEPAGSYGLLG